MSEQLKPCNKIAGSAITNSKIVVVNDIYASPSSPPEPHPEAELPDRPHVIETVCGDFCKPKEVFDYAVEIEHQLLAARKEIARLTVSFSENADYAADSFTKQWRRAEQAESEVVRLTDLVRYNRHELLNGHLISKEEFASLVMDSDGGARVGRLESYDEMRQRMDKAEAALAQRDEELAKLKALVESCKLQGMCIKFGSPDTTVRVVWNERASRLEKENAELRNRLAILE